MKLQFIVPVKSVPYVYIRAAYVPVFEVIFNGEVVSLLFNTIHYIILISNQTLLVQNVGRFKRNSISHWQYNVSKQSHNIKTRKYNLYIILSDRF
jgi:hypothetical protein